MLESSTRTICLLHAKEINLALSPQGTSAQSFEDLAYVLSCGGLSSLEPNERSSIVVSASYFLHIYKHMYTYIYIHTLMLSRCLAGPPWPNGQGVGLLTRRLRVRVPQGVFDIHGSRYSKSLGRTSRPRHARTKGIAFFFEASACPT